MTRTPFPRAMRAGIILLLGVPLWLLAASTCPDRALGQSSERMGDLLLYGRGSALGSQGLAGDLLALRIDPTVAAGAGLEVEFAGGSHELDLEWAAAGVRFQLGGRQLAFAIASLSYGEQRRTALDDRLGLFGGSFTPGDASLSAATVLLQEGPLTVGFGGGVTFARLDDARATLLTVSLAARRRFGPFEARGSLSNIGAVLSPFASGEGTKLPARIRLGGAWQVPGAEVELSGETLWRAGDETWAHSLGVEWRPVPAAALRLGSTMGEGAERFADGGLGELGLTAGVAWQIGSWHIAYVHRPGGVLGDGNVLAIGWRPIP